MWNCKSCGTSNPDNFSFCNECGAEKSHAGQDIRESLFTWRCSCGTVNEDTYIFCTNCGKEKGFTPPTPPKQKKKTQLNNTMIICATAVLVALILLISVLIMSSSRKQDSAVKPTPAGHTATPWVAPPSSYTSPPATKEPEQKIEVWSDWSTTPITSAYNTEVRTRTSSVAVGYYMVHYGTQESGAPHYRMFRDYSIAENYSKYGARKSYGEKYYTKYVSAEKLNYANAYPANGDFVTVRYNGETYEGYQMGSKTGYNFGDDKYIWFIESTDYADVTEYSYRKRIS